MEEILQTIMTDNFSKISLKYQTKNLVSAENLLSKINVKNQNPDPGKSC